MRIGKYETDEFAEYLRQFPELMGRLMRLYNDFDLEALQEFLSGFSFEVPFVCESPTHKRYAQYKAEIDKLIREADYSESVRNQDYLDDEYIKRIYGGSAVIYDNVWGGTWPYEMRKEIAYLLDLRMGEKVLEVGVGTGTNLEVMPDYCEVTGIDYCQEMLDIAREKAKRMPHNKSSLELMDATEMTFPDNSFDKVLSFYTLCACRDPLKVLEEMSRVCKPLGRIVIFDVVKSDIEEVALIQYLYRPIGKTLGAVYLESCPAYVISYDPFLDLFSLLKRTFIKVDKVQISDPYHTVALLSCTNTEPATLGSNDEAT
jgi:phosphatidylethanolamine/phosphatidyl-N-methylethanolamine N-methyltransferase